MAKNLIIDLKPEEAGILSILADCVELVKTNPILRAAIQEVFLKSTPRARKIANLILDGSREKFKGRYGFMAQRFITAAVNNRKQMRILSSHTPKP